MRFRHCLTAAATAAALTIGAPSFAQATLDPAPAYDGPVTVDPVPAPIAYPDAGSRSVASPSYDANGREVLILVPAPGDAYTTGEDDDVVTLGRARRDDARQGNPYRPRDAVTGTVTAPGYMGPHDARK